MAHAAGWIQAYETLENGLPLSSELKMQVISNRNGIGETMLHWYAIEGDTAVVKQLIDLGLNVNTTNNFSKTPLYECISIDRWEMVKLLLDHGANPAIKDENGENIFECLEYFEEQEKLDKLSALLNT